MKMKKQLFLMYVMILFCIVFVGCTATEIEWEVTKDPTWEIVAKGEIKKIIPIQGCSGEHESRSQWCKEYYEFYIDEKTLLVGKIKNIGLIDINSTGKLYKLGRNKNKFSWFQWIPDVSIIKSKIIEEPKTVIKESRTIEEPRTVIKEVNFKVGEWNRADDIKNLEVNTFVLIKLSDDIITTGFITYDKKWKLGTNKNKYQNGQTLKNVVKWKKINLEG